MKPGGGRAKGAAAEREVVRLLQAAGYTGAHRTAPMQAGKRLGYPDIDGTPWWIEVKCYRRTPVNRFAREVLDVCPAQGEDGRPRMLIWRDNRTPWRVTEWLGDRLPLPRPQTDRAEIENPPF